MAYDIKFMRKALSRLAAGYSQRETACLFGIGTTTLKRWKKRLASGEGLTPRIRKRNPKKIPPADLRAALSETPDAYCAELAERFGCAGSSVWNATRKLGLSLKKKRRPSGSATRTCARPSARR